MNKQQLATKIWESANKMRSKIEANEYKDYILGFIFYKYLSDKEIKFLKENDFTDTDIKALSEDDADTVKFIQDNVGYFIAYKDLFSTWLKMGKDFDVSNVRDALSAFSRLINSSHKKVFERIFDTLQTGLSKLGESSGSQTKSISELIQLIKDIPMDGKQDYDVLGFIYEYLISMFAANAGKKAGEFYTPHEVSLLMSEIVADHLKEKNEIKIYDPTSGSGSLLINIGRSVAKHIDDENNIKYYAQELKQNTYNLTRMNLVMRGLLPDNIVTRNGDTLEEDWPFFDESDPISTYNPLYVDAVVSNPPYSQPWDSANKETDPRYSRFGLAPKTKADGIQDYVKGHTHDGEFILIAEDGANDLKNYPVQYVNGKIWVNNHAHVLQAKKDIADNKFLKYVISQTDIEPFLVGGSRAKLNSVTMMGINILAPTNIQEQTKIGSYFKDIDNLIDIHQLKYDKLVNIKKAMFEKMFV